MIPGNSNTLIRYSLDEFLLAKQKNSSPPDELLNYMDRKKGTTALRDIYIPEMRDLINAIIKNIDISEITIKNSIRECLNKINSKNYEQNLEILKSLQIKSENSIHSLIVELITRSMNDTMSIKGFIDKETISDINVKIVFEFSNVEIVVNGTTIKFINMMITICKQYIDDFLNPSNALDFNNMHRVENFKGFMNFMGLLYINKIFGDRAIIACCQQIIKTLKSKFEKKKNEECNNIYKAYEKLLIQLTVLFKKDNKLKIIEKILELNNEIMSCGKYSDYIESTNSDIIDEIRNC